MVLISRELRSMLYFFKNLKFKMLSGINRVTLKPSSLVITDGTAGMSDVGTKLCHEHQVQRVHFCCIYVTYTPLHLFVSFQGKPCDYHTECSVMKSYNSLIKEHCLRMLIGILFV